MQNDLSRQLILEKTADNPLIKDVCYKDSIDSTNELAKTEAGNGEVGGTLYIADQQTSGKGRFKRRWVSPSGTGIWATILLRPNLEVNLSTGYSVLCGVAVARAIKTIAGLNAKIKWPNDVVIGSKKVCGILSEMSAKNGKIDWIVVGFGVNVNLQKSDFTDEIAQKATSLAIEKNELISRVDLLTEILAQFRILFSEYELKKDLSFIAKEYAIKSCVINKQVELIEGENSKTGIVMGFDNEGSLILKTENGLEAIRYGEVSLRGENIYA